MTSSRPGIPFFVAFSVHFFVRFAFSDAFSRLTSYPSFGERRVMGVGGLQASRCYRVDGGWRDLLLLFLFYGLFLGWRMAWRELRMGRCIMFRDSDSEFAVDDGTDRIGRRYERIYGYSPLTFRVLQL
jgi:hypothetical protein